MDEVQPLDRWTVKATARPGKPGQGLVSVEVTNAKLGAMPAIDLAIDWLDSMETVDVEIFGLGLAAQTLRALAEECIREAGRKMSPT